MAKDMNSVNVTGRLGADPEVRYSQSGEALASLRLAVSGSKKSGDGWEEETTWLDVTCFGKTAENVGQYLQKGSRVAVVARLKEDQWNDKTTGEKRRKVKLVASDVVFLDGPKDGQARPMRGKTPEPIPGENGPRATDLIEDDLPF